MSSINVITKVVDLRGKDAFVMKVIDFWRMLSFDGGTISISESGMYQQIRMCSTDVVG